MMSEKIDEKIRNRHWGFINGSAEIITIKKEDVRFSNESNAQEELCFANYFEESHN